MFLMERPASFFRTVAVYHVFPHKGVRVATATPPVRECTGAFFFTVMSKTYPRNRRPVAYSCTIMERLLTTK